MIRTEKRGIEGELPQFNAEKPTAGITVMMKDRMCSPWIRVKTEMAALSAPAQPGAIGGFLLVTGARLRHPFSCSQAFLAPVLQATLTSSFFWWGALEVELRASRLLGGHCNT
jgi:hypothetical protein